MFALDATAIRCCDEALAAGLLQAIVSVASPAPDDAFDKRPDRDNEAHFELAISNTVPYSMVLFQNEDVS